ncbi:MAG: hypothetical protein V2J55_13905 [Candidatus Competibacteraceae bacterium]|jgi:hypothetical protein|nr:hypothetical protein [Candidatus Competibacteraceae bacterium]
MTHLKPMSVALLLLGVFVLALILTWAFGIYQSPEMIYFLENFKLCG